MFMYVDVTTGGGFSTRQTAPPGMKALQEEVVRKYFAQLPPGHQPHQDDDSSTGTGRFDKSKRAFPDISLAGANYGAFHLGVLSCLISSLLVFVLML
jgi:hypothetical protein